MNATFFVQRLKERGFWDQVSNLPDYEQLSKRTGLTRRRLIEFYNGLRPGKLALHSLAHVLECKVEDLLPKTRKPAA